MSNKQSPDVGFVAQLRTGVGDDLKDLAADMFFEVVVHQTLASSLASFRTFFSFGMMLTTVSSPMPSSSLRKEAPLR